MLARRSGRARLPRRAAWAPGFRVARLRGTPYPTLLPFPPGIVEGVLIRPDPAALARLRSYEGRLYALRPLRVRTLRGAVLARAWAARRWMAGGDWTFAPGARAAAFPRMPARITPDRDRPAACGRRAAG